jgi:hypothetical protein
MFSRSAVVGMLVLGHMYVEHCLTSRFPQSLSRGNLNALDWAYYPARRLLRIDDRHVKAEWEGLSADIKQRKKSSSFELWPGAPLAGLKSTQE